MNAASGVGVIVVNSAARGKHMVVKSPMWICVHMISLPWEYGMDMAVVVLSKGGCKVLKGLILPPNLNEFRSCILKLLY